jgi:hypothetical protein
MNPVPTTATDVKTAPNVQLSPQQNTLMQSVLEIYAGNATKERLALWTDDAEFQDPLCIAHGRKQFEAQWVCDLFVYYDSLTYRSMA